MIERIERKDYLDKLIARKWNGRIKIIAGLRRAGKSFLLSVLFSDHLLSSGVKEENIIALAHKKGMRFSTVYASGTSKYAFDGSGSVIRDKDNHSLCTFTTGKRYNADLSASYNIGGRYLIRELLKTCPETEASEAKAKVPGLSARATCTLSTYISLVAVMATV